MGMPRIFGTTAPTISTVAPFMQPACTGYGT
jgi:hypothetical protein